MVAWSLRCLAMGLLLHCGLFALLPYPTFSVPALVGMVLGACRCPFWVPMLVWLGGIALGPPQWVLFETHYNEAFYLIRSGGNGLVGGMILLGSYQLSSRLDWMRSWRGQLGWGLVLGLTLMYPFKVLTLSPQLLPTLDQVPAPGYAFDGIQQLAAFHHYQRGATYYESYLVAFQQDGRNFAPGFPGMSMRGPLLFWLLRPLPSPSAVAWVGWALTMVCALAVYASSCRSVDPLLALPAPVLLLTQYAYVQSNYWLFVQDPWATELLLLGVAFWVLWPRLPLAAICLSLAFAFREFDGPILLAFILLSYKNRLQAGIGSLGLILCTALYAYNSAETSRVLQMQAVPLLSRVAFSPAFGALSLRFGSILLLGRDLLMPLLFLGACLAPWVDRRLPTLLLSGQSVFLFAAFCFLGNGGAYYSFNLMPLAAWAAVLALASQEWPGPRKKVQAR